VLPLLVLLPGFFACGPSEADQTVLAKTLSFDRFPDADLALTNAITLATAAIPEEAACSTAFTQDAEGEAADLAAWKGEGSGRARHAPTTRWLPLQAGLVTVARTPGRAAAQGSASHRWRQARQAAFLDDPQLADLSFEEKLERARTFAETDLDPELVLVLVDATRLDAWLYDPTVRQVVCGGSVLSLEPDPRLQAWIEPSGHAQPDHASLSALVALAVPALHTMPKPTLTNVPARPGEATASTGAAAAAPPTEAAP
jgi:hypothetical protein